MLESVISVLVTVGMAVLTHKILCCRTCASSFRLQSADGNYSGSWIIHYCPDPHSSPRSRQEDLHSETICSQRYWRDRAQIHVTDAPLLADRKVNWLNAFDSHAFPISLALRAVERMALHTDSLVLLGDACLTVHLEPWMYVIHRGQCWVLVMFLIKFSLLHVNPVESFPWWCIQGHWDVIIVRVNCCIQSWTDMYICTFYKSCMIQHISISRFPQFLFCKFDCEDLYMTYINI